MTVRRWVAVAALLVGFGAGWAGRTVVGRTCVTVHHHTEGLVDAESSDRTVTHCNYR